MRMFLGFLLTLVIGITIGHINATCGRKDATTNSDTIRTTDTLMIMQPMWKDSVVVKYVTRWLPVPDADATGTVADTPDADASGTVATKTDADATGTVAVEIPITQKEYADSDYTAWVSGYEPSLDSIRIYRHTETITNTIYTEKKMKRWGVMVGVGGGVTHNGTIVPMVGLMLGYKLF